MTTRPHESDLVVLGVDGSAANLGALRFAVAEARRLGTGLKLVHVVPDYLSIAPMVPLTAAEFTETGTEILRSAEAIARELAPDLEVDGWLHHGNRPAELLRAAQGARVLVVGRDGRPLPQRLLHGDTAAGVAARAQLPVVEVPAEWQPRPDDAEPVVVVGVKASAHASELLDDAFAVAAERQAALVVLHAWKLPTAYDDIVESRVAVDQWRQEATVEMEGLLRPHREAHPDVKVEVRIVHDRPGHALAEASHEADLVVVVRRAHGVPPSIHLGSTARTVLRTAACPVRVVAPVTAPREKHPATPTEGE
ncbi:universal stress protein [Nocardioides sp.]|uniref:universal stress protein n=1 Tax=Nocardioides sp. TaxID=35761 RepID=UPI0037851CDB